MVSMPPYVVEPPDELEVSVRPAVPDLTTTTVTVQADGIIDLGFAGDVYVAGLTLEQVEQKIAQHLDAERRREAGPASRYQVSVRLVNGTHEQVVLRARAPSPPRAGSRSPATRPSSTRSSTAGLRIEQPPREGLPRPSPPRRAAPTRSSGSTGVGIKDRGDT